MTFITPFTVLVFHMPKNYKSPPMPITVCRYLTYFLTKSCTFGKKRKGQKKDKARRLIERWEPINGTGEETAARTFLLYNLSFLASKSCQGNVCFFRAGKAKYIPEVGRKAICSACIRRIHSAAFSKPIHSKSAFSGFSYSTSYNV